MSVQELLVEIEKFIVFSTGSGPDTVGLVILAAMAVTAWISTAVARQVVRFVIVLTRVAMAAAAGMSIVAAACLIFAVLALGG
jgi:hypothetical protein